MVLGEQGSYVIFRIRQNKAAEGDFLPDLCNIQAVFSLILVGELLAFAFVLVDYGLAKFDWLYFGSVSFLLQWIILASAACLCPLRPWFKRQNGVVAGTVSYAIVLLLTLIFTVVGQWLSTGTAFQGYVIVTNLMISAIFAGVVLRYFYLQQQLHNREQAELRSRVQALQSRIRPHFLFNSMNSIASLIDIDPEAAEKMVVDLSQLFRASLSETALVPLSDELELCHQFVSIEQVRLGGRLAVNWDVNVSEYGPQIPSLLLQPLIENAIYHGVQSIPEGGRVDIGVRVDQEWVQLWVANPYNEIGKRNEKENNGMALENINYRLQAHYGDRAEMKLLGKDNQFLVEIRYPY